MGAYADRAGRRPALTLMIMHMVVGTGIIALTLGFATIGAWAPIIIVVARIVQDLSIGGEFAGATAMLVEYAPKERKYFFGSFQMLAQALPLVVAPVVAFLITTLPPPDAAQGWGWRIAFQPDLSIGLIGIYIRRRAGLLLLVMTPLLGPLADRVGPLTVYVPGAVALGALAWPMFAYVGAVPDAARLITVQLLAAVFMSMICGHCAYRSRCARPRWRSPTTAVTLFGGIVPLIVTWLLGRTGDKLVPTYNIIAGTVVALTLMVASRLRAVPATA